MWLNKIKGWLQATNHSKRHVEAMTARTHMNRTSVVQIEQPKMIIDLATIL